MKLAKIINLEKKIQQETTPRAALFSTNYSQMAINQGSILPFWHVEILHPKNIKFMTICTTEYDQAPAQINASTLYESVEVLSRGLEQYLKQVLFIIRQEDFVILQTKMVFKRVNASIYQQLNENIKNITEQIRDMVKLNDVINLIDKEIDITFAFNTRGV